MTSQWPKDVQALAQLLQTSGADLYGGEQITQLQHALQAAYFAEKNGGDAAAICAALLHDIGHLLMQQGDHDLANGIDDQHEAHGAACLKNLFNAEVYVPVALHVEAKRYLCATDSRYLQQLSSASQMSLQLQGGVMDEAEAQQFRQRRYAEQAIFLRHCDDAAKVVDLITPPLAYFMPMLEAAHSSFTQQRLAAAIV